MLADLHTAEGRAFAARYGVSNTTLVFLDADGRPITNLEGVQEESTLRQQIRASFGL